METQTRVVVLSDNGSFMGLCPLGRDGDSLQRIHKKEGFKRRGKFDGFDIDNCERDKSFEVI